MEIELEINYVTRSRIESNSKELVARPIFKGYRKVTKSYCWLDYRHKTQNTLEQ